MSYITAARNAGMLFTVSGFALQFIMSHNVAALLTGYTLILMGGFYTLSYIILRGEDAES